MKEAAEQLKATGQSKKFRLFQQADMTDNGIVFVTCDQGHKTAMVHTSRKYQILFESGCLALLDGYTNEAVSSFSAALERTYEFFLRVAYRKLGIPASLFNSTWKEIRNHSERQYGAFVVLYPIISGESFALPGHVSEFRNKVIHKGYIATYDEVFRYASEIYLMIRQIRGVLNEKCPTEMWAEINEAKDVQRAAVPEGMDCAFLGTTDYDARPDLTAFEECMNEIKREIEGLSEKRPEGCPLRNG
jgi:hypothetical protein